MCDKKNLKDRYKLYDDVISTIMTNILVERHRNAKFLIYSFDQYDDTNKLYFNVTAVAADLNKEKIYLDMPLLDFIFFWKKRRKKRRNLRWLNPIQKKKISDDNKVKASTIMDFICEQLDLNYRLFKEINDEYYGWVD